MAKRDLNVNITGDAADFDRASKSAQASAKVFQRQLKEQEDQLRRQHEAMDMVGRGLVAFGAGVGVALGLATKAAIDWETAWAGVTKTVDGSAPQMAALQEELRALARELPATHEEIAAVAEAAGQLGVERENIVEFTRTMIDLGNTTNLSAEQAATGLARFMNVMGTSQDEVDSLGSALVELGNNSATTEAEILEMAQRLTGAGKQIGITEGDVLGFAAALSSVGIRAEAGGSAFSRVMITIEEAVRSGGEELDQFARVAGMSASEFQTAYQEDAAGAIVAFIQGLGRMQTSGQNVFSVLDQLSLGEIRVRDSLLRAAGASDLFTSSLDMGNAAMGENTALAEEAGKRYETTASQMQIARNNLNDLAITMGETFLPVLGSASDKLGGFVDFVSSLPRPVQQGAAVVSALAGGLSLLGGAALIVVPKVHEFRSTLEAAGGRAARFNTRLGTLGRLLGPLGAAFGVATVAIGVYASKKADAAAATRDFTAAIEADSGALEENTVKAVNQRLEQEGLFELADKLGIEYGLLTQAVLGNEDAQNRLNTQLGRSREGFVTLIPGMDNAIITMDDLVGTFGLGQGMMSQNAETATRLKVGIDGLSVSMGDAIGSAQRKKVADEQAGVAADDHALSVEGLTGQMGAADSAADQLKASLDALTGANISATEAEIRWRDAVARATEGLKDNKATTDLNTESGRRNISAIIDAAESSADYLVALKEQGAGTDELRRKGQRHREQLIEVATQMGLNQDEAQALIDKYLAVPPEVDTDFNANTEGATGKVRRFRDDVNNSLTTIKDGNVTVRFSSGNTASAFATGGPVMGPGTETSDEVPAWLSRNEHVWTGHEVRGAGGHGAVRLLRDLAARGQLPENITHMSAPAFARGGSLREPVNLNVNVTGLEQVKRDYAEFIKDTFATSIGPGPGGAVQRWRPVGLQALAIAGQSAMHINRLLMQMRTESGGNPRAVNRWDINWQRGHPSVGLMQVIGPTYRSYRHPAYDVGPYLYGTSINPLANILASTRYTLARYGSLPAGWRGVGYDQGGIFRSGSIGWNLSGRPERILTPEQTRAFERLVDVLSTRFGSLQSLVGPLGSRVMGGDGGLTSAVENHYHLTVYDAANNRIDLQTQFRRLELQAGVGG